MKKQEPVITKSMHEAHSLIVKQRGGEKKYSHQSVLESVKYILGLADKIRKEGDSFGQKIK